MKKFTLMLAAIITAAMTIGAAAQTPQKAVCKKVCTEKVCSKTPCKDAKDCTPACAQANCKNCKANCKDCKKP